MRTKDRRAFIHPIGIIILLLVLVVGVRGLTKDRFAFSQDSLAIRSVGVSEGPITIDGINYDESVSLSAPRGGCTIFIPTQDGHLIKEVEISVCGSPKSSSSGGIACADARIIVNSAKFEKLDTQSYRFKAGSNWYVSCTGSVASGFVEACDPRTETPNFCNRVEVEKNIQGSETGEFIGMIISTDTLFCDNCWGWPVVFKGNLPVKIGYNNPIKPVTTSTPTTTPPPISCPVSEMFDPILGHCVPVPTTTPLPVETTVPPIYTIMPPDTTPPTPSKGICGPTLILLLPLVALGGKKWLAS